MKYMAMKARILADDLQVISVGPRHLENVVVAFDKTHTHLEAMGANVAANKSLTFASNAVSRKWLEEHRWARFNEKIPVITDARDVGAHLSTQETMKRGTAPTERMMQTTSDVKRLDYLRAPYEKKRK